MARYPSGLRGACFASSFRRLDAGSSSTSRILLRVGATGANVAPDSSTRMTRSDRCRPSQESRGSAYKLVRPSAWTTPDSDDAALAKPASSAIWTCLREKAAISPNG